MDVENFKTFSTRLWKTLLLSLSYQNSSRFVSSCDTCKGVHYIGTRQIFLVLYMSRREFHPMLTVTETVERSISADEKIALDNQLVCEKLIQAIESQDKPMALQYAKVMMLKAMTL